MIMRVYHQFGPFYKKDSKILILGSFPSVKSREVCFYYGHPQNRFWKVLAGVFEEEVPVTLDDKKSFLIQHQIALWDVIESCEIQGSSDASIRNAEPTDLAGLMQHTSIEKILINGKTAYQHYRKTQNHLEVQAVCLPSTSPANAVWSLENLIKAYQEELKV